MRAGLHSHNALGNALGLLQRKRDFNDRQTNILEVVAGRLASDLEREMLLRAGSDGAEMQKQMAAAERLQRNELPTIAPLLDGWDVAGWTAQAEGAAGHSTIGSACPRVCWPWRSARPAEQGIVGALTANAVKTAVRAHGQYHRQAERMLQQVNLTLWTGSAGDQQRDLFCGLIETATGRVCCSSAGPTFRAAAAQDGWQSLSQRPDLRGKAPRPTSSSLDMNCSPARRW